MKMSDQSRAMTAATLPAARPTEPPPTVQSPHPSDRVDSDRGVGGGGMRIDRRPGAHAALDAPRAGVGAGPGDELDDRGRDRPVGPPERGRADRGSGRILERRRALVGRRRRPDHGPVAVASADHGARETTAQVRNALLRLTTVERRYRLDRVDYTNALLTPSEIPPGKWLTSIASFYGAPLFGNGVACGGILHPWTLGVANKTLPCGTKVLFRYGGRAIEVKVIDRGPYIAGREWDLTAATAVALHFPGLGPVQWRLVR
jgi:hypothetical protein